MKITIDLTKSEIRLLSELTGIEIDTEEPDEEDVAYAINILMTC